MSETVCTGTVNECRVCEGLDCPPVKVAEGQAKTEALIEEAAQAVAGIKSVDDLEARAGVLRERVAIPCERLGVLVFQVPEGYTSDEAAAFKHIVASALEQATKDADAEVRYHRTWGDQ